MDGGVYMLVHEPSGLFFIGFTSRWGAVELVVRSALKHGRPPLYRARWRKRGAPPGDGWRIELVKPMVVDPKHPYAAVKARDDMLAACCKDGDLRSRLLNARFNLI